MARPPMHALQGFVAAARLGNLSRAAESLHLTVSALSHQMRSLEERLGYPLLVREARGVSLTAEGRHLLERIGPHLDAIQDALQPFAARHDNVLSVSVTPTMASAWLVPRLSRFLAAHPQIELSLQSSTISVDFERYPGVDAALRIGHGHWPGVVAEHLFDEWLAPVASPALVERMGGADAPSLEHWPLLGDPDPDTSWHDWLARLGSAKPSRYAASFNDSEALHRAAVEGVGVALGRLTRARLLLESGQLVRLSPVQRRAGYAHYLVYPPRSQSHVGVQAFREWLLLEAEEHDRTMALSEDANDDGRPAPAGA